MVTDKDVVEYARSWIGARWEHQGRGYGTDRAIDCVGLLTRICDRFSLPYEDVEGYRREPQQHALVRHLRTHTLPGKGQPNGAIAVFSDTTQACHVGVLAVSDDGYVSVIHSEAWPSRQCLEEGLNDSVPALSRRLVDVRLFKGVTYGSGR